MLHNRTEQSRFLYLFYDKESINFCTYLAEFSKKTYFQRHKNGVSCTLLSEKVLLNNPITNLVSSIVQLIWLVKETTVVNAMLGIPKAKNYTRIKRLSFFRLKKDVQFRFKMSLVFITSGKWFQIKSATTGKVCWTYDLNNFIMV